MMNSGEIVLDIKDEERKGLTVSDLLGKIQRGCWCTVGQRPDLVILICRGKKEDTEHMI